MTDRPDAQQFAAIERLRCSTCRANPGKPCVDWRQRDRMTNEPFIRETPHQARQLYAAALAARKPAP
jgi:hypothetical protein